jgi:hypothetical protein
MGAELGWNAQRRHDEMLQCIQYLRFFGGPQPQAIAQEQPYKFHHIDEEEVTRIFRALGESSQEKATNIAQKIVFGREDVRLAGELLGHSLTDEDIDDCFQFMTKKRSMGEADKKHRLDAGDGRVYGDAVIADRVSAEDFTLWWNRRRRSPGKADIKPKTDDFSTKLEDVEGPGTFFG